MELLSESCVLAFVHTNLVSALALLKIDRPEQMRAFSAAI
jgi:hypothetical protein